MAGDQDEEEGRMDGCRDICCMGSDIEILIRVCWVTLGRRYKEKFGEVLGSIVIIESWKIWRCFGNR